MKKKLLISILLIVSVLVMTLGVSYATIVGPNNWEIFGPRDPNAARLTELFNKIRNGTITPAEIVEFEKLSRGVGIGRRYRF